MLEKVHLVVLVKQFLFFFFAGIGPISGMNIDGDSLSMLDIPVLIVNAALFQMNLKLLLTSSILLALCCCSFAQKGKMESYLNSITVSHDTIPSMSACTGKALFPTRRPLPPGGRRLMMSSTRGSV